MHARLGLGHRASRLVPALLLAAAPLLWSGPARADGAFPDSLSVMTPEQLPDTTLLATNFGLVISLDREQTWVWACEQGANSFATLYQMGPPPKNRIYAISPTNLIYSDDSSCTWTAAAPDAVDAFVDPTNANRVLAVIGTPVDGGTSIYTVVESSDGGATFPQLRYTAPAGDHITGVEISRSSPQTVYLTLTSSTYTPMVAVTTNGGIAWTVHDLTTALPTGTYSLLLVAVDPTTPQTLFLRVGSPAGQALAVSTNGGLTVSMPLNFPAGVFSAFTRMASGSLIAGGVLGTTSVAYRSTDQGKTFQPLPAVPFTFKGLSSRGSKLYGATDNSVDKYAIYTSPDEGTSWQPLMAFGDYLQTPPVPIIQAIVTCLQQYCQPDCENRAAMSLFATDDSDSVCTSAVMPAPLDGGSDAATSPVRDAGRPPSSDGGGHPAEDAGGTGGAGSGCHCDLAPGAPAGLGPWLLLAAAALGSRRRRR
jgi:MYXO-CTERM domain-containing protein